MVKPWMLKGPLMFYLAALLGLPFMFDMWSAMSRGTIVFVLVIGPLLAIPTFMPTTRKGTD